MPLKPTFLFLTFTILLLSDFLLPAQPSILNFQHLTPADGLSHSDVLDILQDRRGFIWLATRNGLNRYDGHSFKTYFADPEDTTSLSGSWLYNVAEDSLGNIWVSTLSNGVCRLDPRTGVFTRFRHDPDDPNSLATDNTGEGNRGEIFVDRKGIVWISTDAGLERFYPATNSFQHFPDFRACLFQDSDGSLWFSSKESEMVKWDADSGEKKRYQLPASSVSENVSMIKDPAGYYLLATRSSGIFRFDLSEEKFSHLPFPVSLNEQLQSTFIFEIAIDPTGLLWIITGKGIYTYDPETKNWQHYVHNPLDPHTISTNSLLSILIDREERVWIGSEGGGLDIWDPRLLAFEYIQRNPSDPYSLSHNNVTNIYEDTLGNLWVGTWGGGLNYLDRSSGQFTHYLHDPARPGSFPSNLVSYMVEDERGEVRFNNIAGPVIFHEESQTFQPYIIPDMIIADRINERWASSFQSLFIDSNKNHWYQLEESGLLCYNPATGQSDEFFHDPKDSTTLSSYRVVGVYEDSNGRFWVPTWDRGLNLFHPETKTFTRFLHDPKNPKSIPSNTVFLPFEDSKNRFWFGTREGGMSRLVTKPDGFEFINYHPSNSDMPGDIVTGIEEDRRGYLWISTWVGVCRFDPETETFKNFNFLDGRASFNWWNTSKGRDGQLYFGCSRGFFIIYPETIQDNTQAPPVFFTDFQLHNRPAPIRGTPGDTLAWASPLEKDILFTDNIQLAYHQNDLSITFTALNYTDPMRNRYRYRLVGYDEEWIETDASKPFANYTNLSHGRYTFEVYGTNNDGVESTEPAILAITITPPWWLTWWAKGGYVIFGLGVLGLIRRSELQKERRKLEHEQEKLAQQQRVNAVTSKFVPNAFIHSLGRKDIMEVQLGDSVAREVTVMFSDLRDYTRLSEQMTPEENFRFITAFNRRMGPIIQQHDGFINQYLGDAIMSIFQESPADALRAAIAMQRQLSTYNEQRTTKGRPPLHMGIGLHTGPLIMGIIGDEQRMDAATISDTVNTAARLESLTKYYGVNILLTEESAERTASAHSGMGAQAFSTRYLGRVLVKGKAHPVGLYECFDGDAPGMAEKKRATLPLFEKGLQLYFDKSFAQAAVCFEKILHEHPEDRCAQLFLQKATRNMQEDVSEDWTGVEVMDRK